MATPAMTRTDAAWCLVMGALVLPALLISMFVSAAYGTPWLLGVANCTERDALGKLIEFLMLFGGMAVGFIIGFGAFGVLSRSFASPETRARWKLQFENWPQRHRPINRWLGARVLKLIGV